MDKTYTCEGCKQVFPYAWTDAEAMAEYEAKFGKPIGEELGILCDECQKSFDVWFAKQELQ